ncbi:unnamed protein product [Cochlearia groenlandica]
MARDFEALAVSEEKFPPSIIISFINIQKKGDVGFDVDNAIGALTLYLWSEEEKQCSPTKKYKFDVKAFYRPELVREDSDQEWDVDSFDGREYESDSDIKSIFSDEEDYMEYSRQKRHAFDCKGFIYEPLSGCYPEKDFEIMMYDGKNLREYMTDLANLCVNKYNEEKGKTVKLYEIVRVIVRGGSRRKNYITFMAQESLPDGPLVEYQAKVVSYVARYKPPFPILCRPAAIPTI